MRGEDRRSEGFFSYVRLEARIPADHPLRPVREITDEALRTLSPAFSRLYSREGRPSIPPERLLRALLLQAFYTVRSERQLMEQLDYNLLFRWFVGLSADDPVWDATVFCKNRDRLLDGDIAAKFFASVLNLPQVRELLSSEHFSVDGTLIEAWASMKSFVPKDGGNPRAGKDDSEGGGRHGTINLHQSQFRFRSCRPIFRRHARSIQPGPIARPTLGKKQPQRQHDRYFTSRQGQRHQGLAVRGLAQRRSTTRRAGTFVAVLCDPTDPETARANVQARLSNPTSC